MTAWSSIRQDLTLHARSIGRALRSLGLPGAAALVCLAVAAVLALHFTPSREAQAEELAVQQAQWRRSLRAQGPAWGADTPARFLAALPPAGERQQRLADLLELSLIHI